MSYITTYTKLHFYPQNPKAEDICLDDISHALSLITRATGHFPEFYSVGQHCLNCCKEAQARHYHPRIVLACLAHDAAEGYINDVTRSVKKLVPQYTCIEEKLLDIIYTKFLGSNLTSAEKDLVSEIDDTILYYEFVHYMNEEIQPQKPELLSEPVFKFQPFKEVENEYKSVFNRLISEMSD